MSETRARILEAADTLFGEVGFDAATTRQIAGLSQVNKALVHYHFATKSDLLAAVLDRYYDALGRVLGDALSGDEPPRERFGRVVDAYVDFLRDNQAFARIVQREVASGHHIDRIVGHMVPMFEPALQLLRSSYPTTRSGPFEAGQLLVSLYGMVVAYFTYGPVVERLLGEDVNLDDAIARRKQHLRHMIDLIVAQLERSTSDGETQCTP